MNQTLRPLIVYQSRTGNTRQLAEAMAEALDADLVPVERLQVDDFKDRHLVGFGSGIYWTKLDSSVYQCLKDLPTGCDAFVFFSSGFGFDFSTRLYRRFVKSSFGKSGVPLLGIWNCRGHDRHPMLKWMGIGKGRPNAVDIASAKSFALDLKARQLPVPG